MKFIFLCFFRDGVGQFRPGVGDIRGSGFRPPGGARLVAGRCGRSHILLCC